MAKPPASPPHSDIEGVDRDERRFDDPRNAKGDSGAKLKRAQQETIARPEYSGDSPDDKGEGGSAGG